MLLDARDPRREIERKFRMWEHAAPMSGVVGAGWDALDFVGRLEEMEVRGGRPKPHHTTEREVPRRPATRVRRPKWSTRLVPRADDRAEMTPTAPTRQQQPLQPRVSIHHVNKSPLS